MLPPLPGTSQPPVELSDLLMLPNGAVLALGGNQAAWWLLPTGASTWCPVNSKLVPTSAYNLTTGGSRLWWFDSSGNPNSGQATPHSAPLSAFRCGV